MDIKQRHLVNKYLDLFFRRKIFIVVLLLFSLPVGLGLYLRTPKVYESSSLLSYQQQKISPNSMSPDVQSQIRDIVGTLSQIVTSRNNLEKIIKDLDLYPELREKLPIEDVIEKFREKIKITPSTRGNIFTISYSGGQPEKVVRVTNAIAAKFIEENLKYRQERAMDTSSYTNQELQMAKKVMDAQENAMRDYKLKNFNEMPGNREANMSRLTSLQEQYQGKQDSIQDLERTLVLIQDQMNNQKILAQRSAEYPAEVAVEIADGSDAFQRLAQLRLTLDGLLLKYTEKHPEIIRVRKLIAKLEGEVQGEGAAGNAASAASQPTSSAILTGQRAQKQDASYVQTLLQLEAQRNDIKRNIENIAGEKDQLREKIEQYEAWVAAAPVREAEWSSLTREYDQLKKHYDYLVSQNLAAQSMLNLEERQKGSQFKIEDPGRFPGKPVKPDFLMIMGMSVLVGFGLGIGGVLVLDIFDASFRDPETLESSLGVPLLITIPYIETQAEVKKKKWLLLVKAILLLSGSGLVAAMFALVWVRGYIVL
jgi:polysaccharide chain length determinant protein (PEP-CTERM system associated)